MSVSSCQLLSLFVTIVAGDDVHKTIYADKYRQIGLKIAYYRKLRGLTQEQLAEKLELSPALSAMWRRPMSTRRYRWTRCSTWPPPWMCRPTSSCNSTSDAVNRPQYTTKPALRQQILPNSARCTAADMAFSIKWYMMPTPRPHRPRRGIAPRSRTGRPAAASRRSCTASNQPDAPSGHLGT